MPGRIHAWLKSQRQTQKFHPLWIVMVVVVTLLVAGIVWIPAMLVSETKPPPASTAPPSPGAEQARSR